MSNTPNKIYPDFFISSSLIYFHFRKHMTILCFLVAYTRIIPAIDLNFLSQIRPFIMLKLNCLMCHLLTFSTQNRYSLLFLAVKASLDTTFYCRNRVLVSLLGLIMGSCIHFIVSINELKQGSNKQRIVRI